MESQGFGKNPRFGKKLFKNFHKLPIGVIYSYVVKLKRKIMNTVFTLISPAVNTRISRVTPRSEKSNETIYRIKCCRHRSTRSPLHCRVSGNWKHFTRRFTRFQNGVKILMQFIKSASEYSYETVKPAN